MRNPLKIFLIFSLIFIHGLQAQTEIITPKVKFLKINNNYFLELKFSLNSTPDIDSIIKNISNQINDPFYLNINSVTNQINEQLIKNGVVSEIRLPNYLEDIIKLIPESENQELARKIYKNNHINSHILFTSTNISNGFLERDPIKRYLKTTEFDVRIKIDLKKSKVLYFDIIHLEFKKTKYTLAKFEIYCNIIE